MLGKRYAAKLKSTSLFEELVKRDFKKYKRTVLGMVWSLLSPLLMLLVMSLVFTNFLAEERRITQYIFCGQFGIYLL